MKAKHLNFGNQIQYNASFGSLLDKKYEGVLVKAAIVNEDLYFHIGDSPQEIVKVQIHPHKLKELQEDISYFKDSALIRIDSINGNNILFTTIKFAQSMIISDKESLVFVVNEAIKKDLKKLNIRTNDIVAFFKESFLIDDRCFARTSSKNENQIVLTGHEFECIFQKTEQNIMQATRLRSLNNRNELFGTIVMFQGNIVFQDNLINAQLSIDVEKKYRDSLEDTQELLKLWKLYNELEVEAAAEQIEDMGSIRYTTHFTRVDDSARLTSVFELESNPSKTFINSNMGYAVVREADYIKDDIIKSNSYFVGTEVALGKDKHSGKYQLSIQVLDENLAIPSTGYLMGSFMGSKIIAQRREQALEKILTAKSELPTLKLILQSGAQTNLLLRPQKAVTDNLLKKVFGTREIKFTLNQQEAINIAINTPDIAIIQGPPGTGKTTVIRAIITRLNMINDGDIRILVSSAQHDAVDNAIENVEYGGLPVNRIGGKFADDKVKSNSSIIKWIDDVNIACEKILEKQEDGHERKLIRSILMQLQAITLHKNDEEFVSKQFKEIYVQLCQLSLNKSFILEVERAIRRRSSSKLVEGNQPSSNSQEKLVELLKLQRLDKETYLDDGLLHLNQLVRYCRTQEKLDFDIPSIWTDLRLGEEDELENLLPIFKQSVENLISQFTNEVDVIADTDLYQLSIENTVNFIRSELENLINSKEKTVADALTNFKDELENPSKISELITRYTKVNAATCQQAVVKKHKGLTYDTLAYEYVIIDEAARANPLDLLIPMSLGRKIILVGDHKQLPHLLEKSVVEGLISKKNDPEVQKLLDEPLFSRLFNTLEKTKFSSMKRTAMLTNQYRMHPQISDFVSKTFYNNKLISGVKEEQRLHDLHRFKNHSLAWLNVPKTHGLEHSPNGQSKCRPAEVEKIMQELFPILEQNANYTIGIITFYKRQAIEIQQVIDTLSNTDQSRIEVGTVDSFQGKEFDIVFLSTVRSNYHTESKRRVGFLDSSNRLNVAFSRAKRLLIAVGDAETVAGNSENIVVSSLYEFKILCQKEGLYE